MIDMVGDHVYARLVRDEMFRRPTDDDWPGFAS
jgi:hypothetical protein